MSRADRIRARLDYRDRPASRANQSYHDWLIANGDRHWTFQKNIRGERRDLGVPPTASDMCRVHGRRVS